MDSLARDGVLGARGAARGEAAHATETETRANPVAVGALETRGAVEVEPATCVS
jgi:hypothetical protein